jgi:hypothetical protein
MRSTGKLQRSKQLKQRQDWRWKRKKGAKGLPRKRTVSVACRWRLGPEIERKKERVYMHCPKNEEERQRKRQRQQATTKQGLRVATRRRKELRLVRVDEGGAAN